MVLGEIPGVMWFPHIPDITPWGTSEDRFPSPPPGPVDESPGRCEGPVLLKSSTPHPNWQVSSGSTGREDEKGFPRPG